MTVSDYTYLLNRPDAVNDRRTQELESIISEFPYFQSARALRLKGLYNQNSFQYNQALKVTAAHTTERSVLFDFITSDKFVSVQKDLYEQKLAELHGIDVHESEVVEPVTHADPKVNKAEQSILSSIREAEAAREAEVVYDEVVPEAKAALYAEIDVAEQEEMSAAPDALQALHDPSAETDDLYKSEDPATNRLHELTADSANETGPAEIDAAHPQEKDIGADTPEEILSMGRPLEFSREEKHSFFEWLQLSKLQPIDRSTPTEEEQESESGYIPEDREEADAEKDDKSSLIDKFIEASPKIPPVRQDIRPVPISEPLVDSAELMTETLARVYLEQKKYTKAIQAYEILILKYPEKSSFFADRISEIRNLQQNNLL